MSPRARALGLLAASLWLGWRGHAARVPELPPLPPAAWAKGGLLAGRRLDLQAASAEELQALPGLGPARARGLVELRERRGGFCRIEELGDLRGVGPATLEALRPYVGLGLPLPARCRQPPAPVDLNRASRAELEALPGIGPARAAAIIRARARRPFRSLDELRRVRGIGPATVERLRGLAGVRP